MASGRVPNTINTFIIVSFFILSSVKVTKNSAFYALYITNGRKFSPVAAMRNDLPSLIQIKTQTGQ